MQASTLRLQYRAADTNAGDNQIKPHFNIVNSGSSAVPLSELRIRYWFTRDTAQPQTFNCDWAALPGVCSNLSGAFVQLASPAANADFTLDITFAAVSDLWKFDHDQDDSIPSPADIQQRLPLIDYRQVEFDPAAWRQGRDPQLERTVEYLLEELKKNPRPQYKRPAFPNYHQNNPVVTTGQGGRTGQQ